MSRRATFCLAGFALFLASAFAETKAPASSLAIFFRFESSYSDIALQARHVEVILEANSIDLKCARIDHVRDDPLRSAKRSGV
jgi:hypothetical protein